MQNKKHGPVSDPESTEHSAIDLIDEAVHLLRTAPPGTFLPYVIGVCPFLLGFLFFWADMSRNAFAYKSVSAASLGLALLFVAMKCGQAVFVDRLRAHLVGGNGVGWSVGRLVELFRFQAGWQATGFVILPLALLIAVPFGWVYAFYQNLVVVEPVSPREGSSIASRSRRLAELWPRQNHIGIFVLQAFSFFVFLNWLAVIALVPELLKISFGWESAFTRSPQSLANTTVLAVCATLTYLCVDPLVKAFYLLRTYYGESLKTGRDLQVRLNRLKAVRANGIILALVVGGMAIVLSKPAYGATPPEMAGGLAVREERLDEAIEEVLEQPEYAWRLRPDRAETNRLEQLRWLVDFLAWLDDWIQKLLPESGRDAGRNASNWSGLGALGTFIKSAVYILIGVLLAVLIARLVQSLFRRRWAAAGKEGTAEVVKALPDLRRDDLEAHELPVSRWIGLAREMLERGEYRLALRASFLAQLAFLGDRKLIAVTPFKSNFDYSRELERRSHADPRISTTFARTTGIFESVWYGDREPERLLVEEFWQMLAEIGLSEGLTS